MGTQSPGENEMLNEKQRGFAELTSEVYAYGFQSLFADVQAAVMAYMRAKKRRENTRSTHGN